MVDIVEFVVNLEIACLVPLLVSVHTSLHDISMKEGTQSNHTFEFTRLIFIGSVGVVLSMSTFGVAIGFICHTISLSEGENSSFSSRRIKTTSGKKKEKG